MRGDYTSSAARRSESFSYPSRQILARFNVSAIFDIVVSLEGE
jgi:hypothetical protein